MGERDTWYFAYGSNMDIEQMKERTKETGGCRTRVPAVLDGWELVFNKIASENPREGKANIVPSEGGRVEGCLYLLSEASLRKLDEKEGVATGHYERRKVIVRRADTGEAVECVTYVACPGWVRDGLKPARKYLDRLLAGADCLSEEYVQRLRTVETLD